MTIRLTDEQLDWICERVSDAPRSPLGGRPPTDKRKAVAGIFWILDNGAKWKDLPREYGSRSAVHRCFKRWVEAGVFENIMRDAGRLVEDRGEYRLYECFIDGTFSKAKGGGDGIGRTKAGKGVKIMVLVDARGLPVAVDTASASPHETRLVQQLFGWMLTEETPERVVGDKAYDSDALDEELAADGIELIPPHQSNRRPENVTQDGRPLRRYKRRFTVERTISWFQNFRRLCIRWEKSTVLFQGYLHFACSFMLLREALG
ncbi:MAG: IS5 family transposase [Leptolyngbya sp. PLA2]|nr:IS5 family transposase [Leptolyngbya sp.]MCE7971687.1 IS5 family transposase [Leptolyngbya sp. PL-A2]MCZ7634328.1 IS5 family transposase [Phycisphaerales bacterium]MDL1904874.1 IS5 family transposase [Synechococcales cyanobacterium CNB]GIK19641.1 MAG: IS5 family transposase [Planctomycetota bacterium]